MGGISSVKSASFCDQLGFSAGLWQSALALSFFFFPDRVIAQGLSTTGRTIPPTSSHLISRMIWTKYTSTSTLSAWVKQPGRDRKMTGRGLRERLKSKHTVRLGQGWKSLSVCVPRVHMGMCVFVEFTCKYAALCVVLHSHTLKILFISLSLNHY